MGTGTLTIDLDAVAANWQALDRLSRAATGAVVKADGYGLGAGRVARALHRAGAQVFFVAVASEGAEVRQAVGPEAVICIFSGHMAGDTDMIRDLSLTPLVNSVDQLTRHLEGLPGHPFGLQLDTGMNRLGMEAAEWAAVAPLALAQKPVMVMSHLACADDPDHPMNGRQLSEFKRLTDGIDAPRSLAATGGILLGPEYHFDLTRPGIGLYGGAPYADARPVARLDLPVIQTRHLEPGETAGYGNSWTAPRPTTLATVSGGYADGLIRAMSNRGTLWADGQPCPIRGRVSMDLITADVTDLGTVPDCLALLCAEQSVDTLAEAAGTIGYEILTSLGHRYERRWAG